MSWFELEGIRTPSLGLSLKLAIEITRDYGRALWSSQANSLVRIYPTWLLNRSVV
jgi:hypothetical protein